MTIRVNRFEIYYKAHTEVKVCPNCGEFLGYKEWIIDEDSGWDILIRNLDFDALANEVLTHSLRKGDTVTLSGYIYIGGEACTLKN